MVVVVVVVVAVVVVVVVVVVTVVDVVVVVVGRDGLNARKVGILLDAVCVACAILCTLLGEKNDFDCTGARVPRSALNKCTLTALHACLAHDKHTRSSAPAQHCVHAWHMISTPAQVRPRSTAYMPGT